MKRCLSKTKSGRRCLNQPSRGSAFCAAHRSNINVAKTLAIGAGALVGNAVAPGLGGVVAGGIAGGLFEALTRDEEKTRVFVSFDFDNDRVLKDFVLGQAKLADSPFEVIDHSLSEAAPERRWEKKALAAIRRAEVVLVMVGAETHRAKGVLKEVAMARQAGVKVVQIIGYRDGAYTAVPNAGRLYSWSWPNLKKLLA